VIGCTAWARRIVSGHQFRHGADGLFDRHGGVDPVLVVEIDVVDAEPLQRGVARAAHVLRLAIDGTSAVSATFHRELGGDHDLVAPVGDGPADELLVRERAVHVCGVEEEATEVDSAMYHRDRFGVVVGAVELAHAHAAEAEGGDGQFVKAEGSGLHAWPSVAQGS
jgi:hypothetical protein